MKVIRTGIVIKVAMIAVTSPNLKISDFCWSGGVKSSTKREGRKRPAETPKMKEFALTAVALSLSFSGNQFAETFAQAFKRNGYPIAIIVCPITTYQKLTFTKALSHIPKAVITVPIHTPNLRPFLSNATTAG